MLGQQEKRSKLMSTHGFFVKNIQSYINNPRAMRRFFQSLFFLSISWKKTVLYSVSLGKDNVFFCFFMFIDFSEHNLIIDAAVCCCGQDFQPQLGVPYLSRYLIVWVKNFRLCAPQNITRGKEFWSNFLALRLRLGLIFSGGGGLGGGEELGGGEAKHGGKNFDWGTPKICRLRRALVERGEWAFGGQYSKSGGLGTYRKWCPPTYPVICLTLFFFYQNLYPPPKKK